LGYFDSEENVESYIDMVKGCDGAALVEILRRHLPGGSSVLEIGMGPGKDQLLLSRHYSATGSDSSVVFVDRYKAQQPDADVIVLDAVDLNTRRQFDAIYSNKVLQHLPKMSAGLSIEAGAP